MAKARPLRKTGRKIGGKSAKERQLSSAELKRAVTKRAAKPAALEAAPPLPAPIASFTF